MPNPFEISESDAGKVASNGEQTLRLLESDGRVFRRRAVKGFGTSEPRVIEWVVAELDGVRVYFDGASVTVTRRDITP